MRPTTLLPLLLASLSGLAAGVSHAQTPAPQAEPQRSGRIEQREEKIRHEDAGSRIDEVRVGGETRSITVQPKDAPAYEVQPHHGTRAPATLAPESSGAGTRVWKIGNF